MFKNRLFHGAYYTESQVADFKIEASVVESFYRKAVALRLYNIDVGDGVLSQISSWLLGYREKLLVELVT